MSAVNDNLGTSYAVVAPATINVKSAPYSAVGDGQVVTDGAITINTATLVCATSAPFTTADVGKTILVTGAGSAPSILKTTISDFVSASTVTLATNALATVASGGRVRWGTQDDAAIAAAYTAARLTGGKIFWPRGIYFTATLDASRFATTFKDQIISEGEGFQETVIQHTGTNVCLYLGGSCYTTWKNMSIDSNGSSQVGVLACRIVGGTTCSHHVFENFGTPTGSVWSKAAFVGISCEETTQRDCNYDNEGGTTGTLYYTNKNTQIAVTLPNSDTISESSAVANSIVGGSITTANAGAACVTVEYGAEVAISGRTFLGIVGATTTSVAVRIAGDSTIPSYCPVVISDGCDIEMNGGPLWELKSYSGTNTIAGPIVRDSFIPQSTQIITYSGTIVTNGLIYDGPYEYQTASTLTLTGTHNFPQITITGASTNVVLSSGMTLASGRIFARSFTDSGATYTGVNDLHTLTTAGSTVASMTANRQQAFIVEITNTAGTLQHRVTAGGGNMPAGVFADRISGASATLANTPSLDATTAFVSGGGLLAAATHIFILNTADQVLEERTDGVAVLETNDTTNAVVAKYVVRSDNVNGVTRFRPTLQFANPTTNATFGLTTVNIGAGLKMRIHVRAGIA